MKILLFALALLVLVTTLVPFLRREEWWIRVFDFPRLQAFVVGALTLGALPLLASPLGAAGWGVAGLLAVCLVVQAARIFPYTRLAPRQVKDAVGATPERTISLLVANVLMDNRDAERLLAIIRARRPDLVLTLEPDAWWERQLAVLEPDYPYTVKQPLDNRYGILLHARYELVAPEIKYLLKEGIPSIHTRVRLPSGDVVWLHCLHPEPPSPTEADTSLERDAELLMVGKEVRERDAPTIVAGDLNDVAWSDTTTLFQKISGLLDPRNGRGMFNTFHAEYPLFRWPLDHIFHSDHFTLLEMARESAFGSDHFPVFAKLYFQPSAAAEQEEPEADQDEREEADAKIEKAGATP